MSLAVKDHVKGQATFVYAKDGCLWYELDTGLVFPVPFADAEGAEFRAQDKAILFMRWVRKHLALIEESKE